jgi:putative hydrolase
MKRTQQTDRVASRKRLPQALRARLSNREVAALVREIADRLQRAGDSPYRVAAYRRGAVTLANCPQDLNRVLAAEGERGLRRLKGIGKSLARTTARLLRRGRTAKLDRLRRQADGPALLRTLPGVGEQLAERLEKTLPDDSLEEVYAAAYDGRLRRVRGLGEKRLRAIRESLAFRLQAGAPLPYSDPQGEPPIADLLSIDREYRDKAARGRLPLSTPRLFNPTGQAWLPVLRTERGGLLYAAHFANSAQSHRLGRVQDWVVITCDTKERYGQWTVITATRGALRDKRLVMHREPACREYYAQLRTQLDLPLGEGLS